MNKTEVVVLGRNYVSLLGMIRAAGESDCEVNVVKTVRKLPQKSSIKEIIKKIIYGKPIESQSKYVKKYLYAIEPNREKLVELLLSEFSNNKKEKLILIPTDDFTASTIDMYQDKLEDVFLFPSISRKKGEVVRMMNKGIQKRLASENGLNVAKGYIVNYNDEKYEIPEGIDYPIFTKPQISFKGDKTLMKKCNNEVELVNLLNYAIEKYKCPILIEQYVEIEKEYGVLGCSYNGEVIIPGIITKIKSGNGGHKGVTLLGETSSFEGREELCEQLKKFIKTIGFNGLFDIDIYESKGKIYFNELNLRFGAGGYGITKSGVNLPQIFIHKLLNIENTLTDKIQKKRFISEKVNLEDFEAGYIDWKEYKKEYNNVDFCFIKSENDPKPYVVFKKKELYVRLKVFVKKLKGKKWRKL